MRLVGCWGSVLICFVRRGERRVGGEDVCKGSVWALGKRWECGSWCVCVGDMDCPFPPTASQHLLLHGTSPLRIQTVCFLFLLYITADHLIRTWYKARSSGPKGRDILRGYAFGFMGVWHPYLHIGFSSFCFFPSLLYPLALSFAVGGVGF